ncbi:hypothetical protein VMCG_09782 [Cytospora schulzeri]|uniref:HTH myb-type domain-containing protein n=1 Tax=Cytospora schulzeri TaxID=448051 RepID=A0A423VGQ5_9PEZI|nr:hypothetical protein VMCG_09782 [Valsa malicola]
MMPEPLMAVPPGVVPRAVLFELQLQLQLQVQQLGAGQEEDRRQIGAVGGDDAPLSINEAFYNLNQIADGDIDLDPSLHPAPPSMQQWQVTPMGASYATAYGQPSSTNHQQQVNDDFHTQQHQYAQPDLNRRNEAADYRSYGAAPHAQQTPTQQHHQQQQHQSTIQPPMPVSQYPAQQQQHAQHAQHAQHVQPQHVHQHSQQHAQHIQQQAGSTPNQQHVQPQHVQPQHVQQQHHVPHSQPTAVQPQQVQQTPQQSTPQPAPTPAPQPRGRKRGGAAAAAAAGAATPTAPVTLPPQPVQTPVQQAASGQTPIPVPTPPAAIATPTQPAPVTADSSQAAAQPPPAKKSRTNTPWTPAEELRLKQMRDAGQSWAEIAKTFPTRTEGSVKKHWYKDMHYAEFAEDESQALANAIKEYENNKWKVIGQKVGKPAKACEQYAKEHFPDLFPPAKRV